MTRSRSTGDVAGPAWFGVAVQALIYLAQSDGICPSGHLAGQVRSHAVFLRRVLAYLARAGLVEAREGRDGGYRLALPAAQITLADVYRAVHAQMRIELAESPDGDCPMTTAMHQVMHEVAADAERSILETLSRRTIAGLMDRTLAISTAHSGGPFGNDGRHPCSG